jgi:hypothetical protein
VYCILEDAWKSALINCHERFVFVMTALVWEGHNLFLNSRLSVEVQNGARMLEDSEGLAGWQASHSAKNLYFGHVKTMKILFTSSVGIRVK